jgi:hypothetical protein
MAQIVTKYNGISVGDVVNLKSGSPDLTVVGFAVADAVGPVPPNTAGATFVEESLAAVCFGFNTAGASISGKFPVEVLNVKTPVAPAKV